MYRRCFGECEEGLFPRRAVLLVTVLPDPAPPPRHEPRRDPPVVCPGFGTRQVKYKLDCSCFRIDVQDSLLDSLEGKREGCLRAGSTQRRPVLPSSAQPRRPAVRPAPTRPARGVSGSWIRQVECHQIGRFRMTNDSIQPFRPNAIRSSFRVYLGLIFGLLSDPRFDSSRNRGLIPRPLSGLRSALLDKSGLIPELLSGPRCDPSRRRGVNAKLLSGPRCDTSRF